MIREHDPSQEVTVHIVKSEVILHRHYLRPKVFISQDARPQDVKSLYSLIPRAIGINRSMSLISRATGSNRSIDFLIV